eukprot:1160289-Pelagomonas_calceolata.AAC.2
MGTAFRGAGPACGGTVSWGRYSSLREDMLLVSGVLDQCAEVLFSEVMLRSSGGGLGLSIEGRLKSLHSVYRKMVRKGCSVAEVFDARALRVIVDDEGGTRSRDAVETCYKLVSTVHSIWKPVPHVSGQDCALFIYVHT